MTDGLGGSIDDTNNKLDGTISRLEKVKGLIGQASTGAKTMVTNLTTNMVMGGSPASATAQAMSGGATYVNNQSKSMYSDPIAGKTWANAIKGIGGTYGLVAGLLPTTQETTNMGSIAERMRFYSSNLGNGAGSSNPLSSANNIPGYQYSAMRQAMRMGTAVGPDDITQAINAGVKMGLGPGLSNYHLGAGFSGILGGAALASNLSPGIGLTGGMGVMAGINSAQSVNMLRMLGINVRGKNGATMNDLPQIIDQLYALITRNNPNPTPADIATSLMPGNALDSLINQYFGGDPNTREVIVAGLIQKTKVSGSLRQSGTKGALGLTGGTNSAISSISNRNLAEAQLIQAFTDTTNKAMIGTNNFIQGTYTTLGNNGASDSVAGDALRGVQNISTMLTTVGGMRNGAGANILQAVGALGGKGLKKLVTGKGGDARFSPGKMLGLVGAGAMASVFGVSSVGNLENSANVSPVGAIDSFDSAPFSKPSTVGNSFSGDITINVTVPPGSDPYAYKSALADIWS